MWPLVGLETPRHEKAAQQNTSHTVRAEERSPFLHTPEEATRAVAYS